MLKHLFSLTTVDSTNTWARKHLHTFDVNALTIIWTENQTQGRGQRDNNWFSPPQENLSVSFVYPFDRNPFLLSQLSSLAVQKTLALFHVQAHIKWPNDLLTHQGKISGILVEHAQEEIGWGIIGIGINVNMKNPPQEIKRAITSIYIETKKSADLVEVLNQLTSILQYYLQLPPETIQAEWLEQVAWMIGTQQVVQDNGASVPATILKISPQGFLTCLIEGREKMVTHLI